jgi:hypothetical protein
MRQSFCSRCFAPLEEGKYGIQGRRKFCFDCCAERDKEQMRKTGRIVLYLEKRETGTGGFMRFVTNFPGSLEISAFGKTGRHNIAGKRVDVNFYFEGTNWHGVQYGCDSQLCYCRRLKPKTFEEEAHMAYQPLFAKMGDTTGRHWQTSSCRGRVNTVGFKVNSTHGQVGRVFVEFKEGEKTVQKPDFRKISKEKRQEALDTYRKACEMRTRSGLTLT